MVYAIIFYSTKTCPSCKHFKATVLKELEKLCKNKIKIYEIVIVNGQIPDILPKVDIVPFIAGVKTKNEMEKIIYSINNNFKSSETIRLIPYNGMYNEILRDEYNIIVPTNTPVDAYLIYNFFINN